MQETRNKASGIFYSGHCVGSGMWLAMCMYMLPPAIGAVCHQGNTQMMYHGARSVGEGRPRINVISMTRRHRCL